MRTLKFLCLILVLHLIGCQGKQKTFESTSRALKPTYFADQGITNPVIRGTWKSIGNGYYLEARADSILLYSYTKRLCYKEKNDYLEGLLNSQSQFKLHGDTLHLYLTYYSENTRWLQSKKDFVRVDQLQTTASHFQR